jgi:hypothetical protein
MQEDSSQGSEETGLGPTTEKRYTVLTERAQTEYNEHRLSIDKKLTERWFDTQDALCKLDITTKPPESIEEGLQALRTTLAIYRNAIDELFSLLIRANSRESLADYAIFQDLTRVRERRVRDSMKDATSRINAITDKQSVKSKKSQSSVCTVISEATRARAEVAALAAASAVKKERANIELQRARLEEEEELRRVKAEAEERSRVVTAFRRKVEFDSNMLMLEHEEREAVARARAYVFGREAIDSLDQNLEDLPDTDAKQLVQEFVDRNDSPGEHPVIETPAPAFNMANVNLSHPFTPSNPQINGNADLRA